MVICGTSRPDPITKRLRSSHGAYRTSQLPMIWRLWPKTEIKSNSKCWQWKFDHKTSELILLIFSWLLWTSLHVLSHKFTSLKAHYLVMNKISTKLWLIFIISNFIKQRICNPDLPVPLPRRLSTTKIAVRWRYRLPIYNLKVHYDSQFCVSFHFCFAQEAQKCL